MSLIILFFFFFFSSRRRHTRLVSDWSSDVCSSDLFAPGTRPSPPINPAHKSEMMSPYRFSHSRMSNCSGRITNCIEVRSEERRVGKSVELGGRRVIKKKNRKRIEEYAEDIIHRRTA